MSTFWEIAALVSTTLASTTLVYTALVSTALVSGSLFMICNIIKAVSSLDPVDNLGLT